MLRDDFDPVDREFVVLGVKTCAEVPNSTIGTAYDPWQIAGETSAAPDGANDETGTSEYASVAAVEPGHVWPFMSWSATVRSTLSPPGYFPACRGNEGYNHYRRFVRLAPRMFGSDGRCLEIRMTGLLKATNAANCLDILIPFDLVTATPTTTLTAGKYVAFRFPLGNLGANEVPFTLTVIGQPMGPHRSVWEARLRVAAQTNGGTSNPALDLHRGPVELNLTSTGPDMDTTGAQMGFLYAARRTTAINVDTIGSSGSAVQDGTEVYVKGGACVCLLWPGN